MKDLQKRVGTILDELKNTIIHLVDENKHDEAELMMGQYIKLSPLSVERYSLEALLRVGKKDLQGAEEILKEGLGRHPLSFDLLYNLGYIFEQKEDFLEAYHIYMKARYNITSAEEKKDVSAALINISKEFKGKEQAKDNEVSTILIAGDIQVTATITAEEIARRKALLDAIEKNIGKDLSTVLEIGFTDGLISKNLNYYGYNVTAVDRKKERLLNIMAREWQENLLQPDQKVAKFYHDQVDLSWLEQIPKFDVIIAVGDRNLEAFNASIEQKEAILELLFTKFKKQLFIRLSIAPVVGEFSKKDLLTTIKKHNFQLRQICENERKDGFELYVIEKQPITDLFSVPTPLEAKDSSSSIIEVELDKCTDHYAGNYINDFQHFVEVLKEYEKNPTLKYEDTILKDYYHQFQPKNTEDALFASERKVPQLRRGWLGYPWSWDKNKKLVFTDKVNDTREGGNHHFGPNTEVFGNNEYQRLMSLYAYFKKQGYYPEMFSDGYISGYLLVKRDDYRFVVVEGQHRVACLAALGYEKIRCRFNQMPQYPRIVDFDDISNWPQVANKVYSRNLARKVFNRFFDEGVGRDRMGIRSQE